MRPLDFLPHLALVSGSSAATCTADAFMKAPPTVFGSEILDLKAEEIKGWNEWATAPPTFPALPNEQKPIDICNVTVVYTHPGEFEKVFREDVVEAVVSELICCEKA